MAGDLDDPFADPAPTPAPKKSFFKKSLFKKQPLEPSEQKEGLDFFSRAEDLWPSRIAEENRKRQKKQEKLERKRSTVSVEKEHTNTATGKRRRVSKEGIERHSSEGSPFHDDADEASWTRRESTLSTPGSRESNLSSQRPPQASPTSLSARYSKLITKNQEAPKQKGYVSLSDSDEGDIVKGNGRAGLSPISLDKDVVPVSKPVVEILEDSDDEFPELRLEARKRAAQKKQDQLKAADALKNKNHTTVLDDNFDDIFPDDSSAPLDPRIEILVSSLLLGTTPMRIMRRMSQKLREVRICWFETQKVSCEALVESMKPHVFLTWKGKRLFDTTNCNSLGVSDGRIHLEVWTQELYNEYQRKLAARATGAESEEEPEVVEEPTSNIRVTLRAQGKEDVKTRVKASTTIRKLAVAYRKKANIPDAVQISFYFDGDMIDSDGKIENTEIEDMDVLEVHLQQS